MDDKTITALAREYAEEYYKIRGGVDLMADEAENVIRFILRRFCLVEKSKMEELDLAFRAKHYSIVVLKSEEVESLFHDLTGNQNQSSAK